MKGLSYSFLRAICALVIGLVLVMFPDQAGDYFVITIGVIFLVPSLVSIIGSAARRWMPVPGGFYVVPVLILLAGLVALFNPTGVRSTAFIIIGISSLVYAASELLNWFKFTRRRPKTPDASVKAVDDIEDAQIIE